ncbi:MAG: amidohydrolase [Bryobacteraceae bacterium]
MRVSGIGIIPLAAVSLLLASPDTILHNGRFVSMDAKSSVHQAIAIESGRIAAVGANAAILSMRGPATRLVDLKGRTVLPGLIDSHVHALSAGLSEFREPLPPLDSFAAIQSFLRVKAARVPKGQWITVPRTFPTRLKEMRMPTRAELDVVATHPVLFDASYSVVVNSYALRMSGITRSTPNPPRGEIVKDVNGEPNGILKNGASLLKGRKEDAGFTGEEKLQALEQMLHRYAEAGLTSVSDRAVTAAEFALYQQLEAQRKLPVRATLTWRLDAAKPTEEVVRQINAVAFQTGSGTDWLRFGAFKVTLDGGMTIGTAYQRVPYGEFGEQLYGQTNKDDRGLLFIPPEKLTAIFRAARAKGWQLTAHCQGGGAVDVFLDALAALDREKPIAATRSHLMHASFQSPEAIARARKMGVTADIQTPWLYHDGPALEKVFGASGMRYFIPLRAYIDAGVIVAAGSDHMIGHDRNRAVNPYNPFLSMWIAITRKTTAGRPIHSEQSISRMEALKMHTIWAAWMQNAEGVKGSLEPGKFADLVVIDRDILTVPEDQIRDILPVLTMVDGAVVYERK